MAQQALAEIPDVLRSLAQIGIFRLAQDVDQFRHREFDRRLKAEMIFSDRAFDAVDQLPVFQKQQVSREDFRLGGTQLRLHALLQVKQILLTVLQRGMKAFNFPLDLVGGDDTPRSRQFAHAEQDCGALPVTR